MVKWLKMLAFAAACAVGTAGCGSKTNTEGAAIGSATADAGLDIAAEAGKAPSEVERYLMSQGAKITMTFPSESGLRAVVAERGQDRRLFYILPDGKHMVVGTIFDATGGDVTSNDMSRASIGAAAGGDATVAADSQLWERAGQTRYIAEGTGENVVYVIFDPNCPYCHKLWEVIRPAVASGRTQVRWIPAAILAASSKNLAAAIYESKDPARALGDLQSGKLTPVTVSVDVEKALDESLQLLRSTGYTGVPTVLYKNGSEVRVTMSALSNESLLNEIFRLK